MFILALDQGTSSSRAIVFDGTGAIRAMAQKEFRQVFPQEGWVEHDPNEIWETQLAVAREALARAGIHAAEIAAIGIANQRETTVLWEEKSGEPIYNAIVWQDRRTAAACKALKARELEPLVREKTGLPIDPYFSATKIGWILDHTENARRRAEAGELRFGTIDSWLIWKLSGGSAHLTDASNAARTLLYNIYDQKWDPELLELFRIPPMVLPQVGVSSGVVATSAPDVFGAPIPISGVAGDQQAALFGQRCTRPGMVKNTYGTGCFLLMHAGAQPVRSRHQLLTTTAWRDSKGEEFALEGSIFIAGAVVQWLRDGLGIIRASAEVEQLARETPDNGGVYFVPAFAGLGSPHWDPYARGTIVGLTGGSRASHIARAALESIAYQTADVVLAMEADTGAKLTELRVDGGATVNDLLMQFQADMLGVSVVRPQVSETTALGAAYLAGLGVGFWRDSAEIDAQWRPDRVFRPQTAPDVAARLLGEWRRAVARARDWTRERTE